SASRLRRRKSALFSLIAMMNGPLSFVGGNSPAKPYQMVNETVTLFLPLCPKCDIIPLTHVNICGTKGHENDQSPYAPPVSAALPDRGCVLGPPFSGPLRFGLQLSEVQPSGQVQPREGPPFVSVQLVRQ